MNKWWIVRTKIQEGGKNIEEVLNWYKVNTLLCLVNNVNTLLWLVNQEVNAQTLKYVTYSIHDSDISDFYRFYVLKRRGLWMINLDG